jgi:hypothetical protein
MPIQGGGKRKRREGRGRERAMTEDLMLFLGLLRRILALIPGTPYQIRPTANQVASPIQEQPE